MRWDKGMVRDAALIAACQRLEHYELAGYGSALGFVKTLGISEVAALLEETQAEEKEADGKLTSISASELNGEGSCLKRQRGFACAVAEAARVAAFPHPSFICAEASAFANASQSACWAAQKVFRRHNRTHST